MIHKAQSAVVRNLGIASVSLSSLCFSASGAETHPSDTKGAPVPATTSAEPLLSAGTRYIREHCGSKKQPAMTVAGVSLQVGSSAHDALSRAATSWRRGAVATKGDLLTVLSACTQETGSLIEPHRLATILKQHPETEVQRAVLTYIYQKPDFRMSPETLSAFLATQEPSLLSLALLIRSKESGRLEQAEKFAPYTRHDDSSVRQAALLAMLSAGIPLPPVSAFDCFAATRHLQRDHYEFGFEARLANAMERAIVEADASIVQQQHINLEMPLMHLLQRIDVACPGYLEQIMQTGPGCFERFCTGLLDIISAEREAVKDRIILDASTEVLVAMHHEDNFTPLYIKALCGDVGVRSLSAIKQAGPKPFTPPSVPSKPGDSAELQQARREFRELHLVKTAPNAKQDYCSLLIEALGSTRGPVAIWHFMHGGVNHTWFSEGVGASVESTDLKDPRAVSYEEMAQILFDSCSTPEGTVECGHITLFLDACYQYTMAEQLQCHLEKLAQESGRALVSYPLVTSISQALMRGKIEQVTDDLEKPSLRYFAPRWHSALREGADDDKRITVEDLLAADNSVHQAFDETIADPRTLRHSAATEHIKDWKKPDSRGLKGMWGEAPAIFGPGRVDLRKELEEMIERLNEDADLKIPAVPDDARLPKYTFLEIG